MSLLRPKSLARLWPRSLTGQTLGALALALLFAQTLSGVLLYRAETEQRHQALVHSVAFRLLAAVRGPLDQRSSDDRPAASPEEAVHGPRAEPAGNFAIQPGDKRIPGAEHELAGILSDEGIAVDQLVVVRRAARADSEMAARVQRRNVLFHHNHSPPPDAVLVAGMHLRGSNNWLVARVFVPQTSAWLLVTLIAQTALIYLVLVGSIALILRHITRPLAALTLRLEHFTATRDRAGAFAPDGPQDVRRLIAAHNAMEARIVALIDEKDVMLGAIGHDLKTPLAALRVRIESVEDVAERARMAGVIEDITASLDDILSLARVGRPTDPVESTELSALVGAVVEEFEDLGENVTLGDTTRMVMPARATWLRRALRNLISNGLRYGGAARVSMAREGNLAVVRIEDDGPGIPEGDIARMMEPFTRGDPSRNSSTGGAGLGLTLARAIADQHGGTLTLTNHPGGLTATLRLPLP